MSVAHSVGEMGTKGKERRLRVIWKKLLQQFSTLSRREPSKFNFDPVTHRLNPHPILPQDMMSAIAPAYEEALAKEKEEKGENAPQEEQE